MIDAIYVVDLGRVEYGPAYALQRQLVLERDAGSVPDLLLLVEHPPVITLGRRGSREDIYASEEELKRLGITVYETNRGGLATYHGPGQIVGYPIAPLRRLAPDAPAYVHRLEETVIQVLASLRITARRDVCHRGVFTHDGKIAAIGFGVTHGVTMHGFALNLQPDLAHFSLINPCGIGDLGVTSAERILGHPLDALDVRRAVEFHFGVVFLRNVDPAPPQLVDHILGLLSQHASEGGARQLRSPLTTP